MNYILIAVLAVGLTWYLARRIQREARQPHWWEMLLRHSERIEAYMSLLPQSILREYIRLHPDHKRFVKMPPVETGQMRPSISFDNEYPGFPMLQSKVRYFPYDPRDDHPWTSPTLQ